MKRKHAINHPFHEDMTERAADSPDHDVLVRHTDASRMSGHGEQGGAKTSAAECWKLARARRSRRAILSENVKAIANFGIIQE